MARSSNYAVGAGMLDPMPQPGTTRLPTAPLPAGAKTAPRPAPTKGSYGRPAGPKLTGQARAQQVQARNQAKRAQKAQKGKGQ